MGSVGDYLAEWTHLCAHVLIYAGDLSSQHPATTSATTSKADGQSDAQVAVRD